MKEYDAIIIGSGQAGTPLAKKLAQAGWKTALVEKRWIGGTCINDGCTPTKALIASAKAAYMAAGKSAELGVSIEKYSINFTSIIKRKDAIVQSFREGSQQGLTKTENLELLFGEAVFTGFKTLAVSLPEGNKAEITADKIFINTGSRTRIPSIEGLEPVPFLTSTTILDLKKVPGKLLILGGGYIGLEYGQMFRRFGSNITIIDTSPRFLPKEDEDIANEIKKVLEEEGLQIYPHSEAIRFEKEANKEFSLIYKKAGEEYHTNFTHLLIATGRQPQSDILKPEVAGIAVNEKGYITVNDRLETNVAGIYALGEANGSPAFTHISYNDYVIVADNLLHQGSLSTKDRPLPYCMFTDPQLGRIGLSENQAKEKGLSIKIASIPLQNVARAIETGETRGLIKAVVDAETKKILGAAVLGAEGGEIMAVLQMAMQAGMTYEQLQYNIFAHPTYAESLNNLFMTL